MSSKPQAITGSKFNRRVTIQQEVQTAKDNAGGFGLTWVTVPGCTNIPAQISYPPPAKKGDEVFTQQQVRSSSFATITIRYRPSTNIDASMQVVYGSRVFNIRTVIPVDEARRIIQMQCEELQSRGSLH